MKAMEFKRPSDLEEAYAMLNSHKKAAVIAGGLFIRIQKISHSILIDLEGLGLDYIREAEGVFAIGAMTSLRSIEKSDLPQSMIDACRQISGIGVRNMATIGGSVCGRYPFSDIDTALMALDADLVFYKRGQVSMREFYTEGMEEQDILIEVKVKKANFSKTAYYKKVYTDFSIVNVSVSDFGMAVGARPGRAIIIDGLDDIEKIGFSDDYRASGEYRRALAKALLEDCLAERSK